MDIAQIVEYGMRDGLNPILRTDMLAHNARMHGITEPNDVARYGDAFCVARTRLKQRALRARLGVHDYVLSQGREA